MPVINAIPLESWVFKRSTLNVELPTFNPQLPLFADELAQAKWEEVAGIQAPVLRLERLLQMKRDSGRPQDLADIEQLQPIMENRKP
jgi:hypothetical protein